MSGFHRSCVARAARRRKPLALAVTAAVAASLVLGGSGAAGAAVDEPLAPGQPGVVIDTPSESASGSPDEPASGQVAPVAAEAVPEESVEPASLDTEAAPFVGAAAAAPSVPARTASAPASFAPLIAAPPDGWRLNSMWYYGPNPDWDMGNWVIDDPQDSLGYVGFETQIHTTFVRENPEWDLISNVVVTGTLVGIPSAELRLWAGGVSIMCYTPDVDGLCHIPGDSYTISLAWTADAYAVSCLQDPHRTEACPPQQISGSTSRTVRAVGAPSTPSEDGPTAGFTWEVIDAAERRVQFTSTSLDSWGGADLEHEWDFGDGEFSTERDPVHRFDGPGPHEVTLAVYDDEDDDQITQTIHLDGGLVVNSTGDAAAQDPADGCDTGDTVGADESPECTLRAAIEAANAAGGGEIQFDIRGTPVIVLGSALPRVTVPVAIDGTTQDGGWVEVVGGGAETIVLDGGASTLSGLALHGAEQAIRVASGEGHTITGVRVGLDRVGNATSDTVAGVVVAGGSAEVSDSQSGAEAGVAAVAPVTVTGNTLGIDSAGAPIAGAVLGVWAEGSGAMVSDNTIFAETAGVLLRGADAAAAQVTGNRIGTDGVASLPNAGIGVSVQGAPRAVITGNTIQSGSYAGVLVSGSAQLVEGVDEVLLGSPLDDPADGAVTGGDATVIGNTIGAGADDSGLAGVWAWAGASGLTVESNTVYSASSAGVILDGGTGHRVAGNVLGSRAEPLTGSGIEASDLGQAVIDSNTIVSADIGIRAIGEAPTVTGNTVTGSGADAIGISMQAERAGLELRGNTVRQAASSGILVDGPGVVVRENTVVQSGVAITASGEGVVLRENLIGAESANGAVLGNAGHGVWVSAGSVEASRNVIAGSGGDGVHVAAGATAKLIANRIWASGGSGIVNPDGPATPGLVAAIIADTDGASMTTLLIDGLEAGETGTIEVFANDAAADAQAQHVLDATRTIKANETVRVVQLASGLDHFTMTFTDSSGNTSELSPAASRQGFPDSDGDGAVDPIDGLLGLGRDPTVAILATRNEQLLLARVTPYDLEGDFGGGRFENLRVADDPTPGAHPDGWSLPYGALAFRISDLPYAGARTSVTFASFYGDDPLLGDAYWKYGPQATGGEASWYEFSWDDQTQTGGAIRVADLGPLGFRPAHVLILEDGARGDSDGGMNRSITDPGGPVISTGGGGGSTVPDPDSTTTDSERLARTGSDTAALQIGLSIALLLAALGSALLLFGGRRGGVRGRRRS